jgi:hypothetical protein
MRMKNPYAACKPLAMRLASAPSAVGLSRAKRLFIIFPDIISSRNGHRATSRTLRAVVAKTPGLIATILECDEKDRLVVLMDLLSEWTRVTPARAQTGTPNSNTQLTGLRVPPVGSAIVRPPSSYEAGQLVKMIGGGPPPTSCATSPRPLKGSSGLIANRHLRKGTKSQGPSLCQHYPTSTLQRPCPTPAVAAT